MKINMAFSSIRCGILTFFAMPLELTNAAVITDKCRLKSVKWLCLAEKTRFLGCFVLFVNVINIYFSNFSESVFVVFFHVEDVIFH